VIAHKATFVKEQAVTVKTHVCQPIQLPPTLPFLPLCPPNPEVNLTAWGDGGELDYELGSLDVESDFKQEVVYLQQACPRYIVYSNIGGTWSWDQGVVWFSDRPEDASAYIVIFMVMSV
jgi:hypothetical protein